MTEHEAITLIISVLLNTIFVIVLISIATLAYLVGSVKRNCPHCKKRGVLNSINILGCKACKLLQR